MLFTGGKFAGELFRNLDSSWRYREFHFARDADDAVIVYPSITVNSKSPYIDFL